MRRNRRHFDRGRARAGFHSEPRHARFWSPTTLALGLSSLVVGVALARRVAALARGYSFNGRTVIITGASRGLGLDLARRLAAEGARLWLVARSSDDLERAASELRQGGALVNTIAADVRQPDDAETIVRQVTAAGGGIDVLINNAGVIEVGPFEHITHEDFENSLATHFWGPLALIRACLPHLRRTGDARIVNISSIGGRIGVPHLSAYAAGKFALTGLSETLRAELTKSGILVTTVTPGLLRTGSYVNVRIRGRAEDEFRWFTAMSATSVTSMQSSRAAAQILRACREGRATSTPGWQARLAHVLSAVAPNAFAALNAAVDHGLLPTPLTTAAQPARSGTEVDPGAVKAVLSQETRVQHHQPEPTWSSADPIS